MAEPCVLLVDDYHDALEIWEWYLRTQGYEVLTATSGTEAIRLAKSAVPDVIVMDLQLPGVTGCEAAREIRATGSTSHIPLIAATGFSHDRQMAEARDAGFERILIKPCDPPTLVEAIECALASRRNGDPKSDDGS